MLRLITPCLLLSSLLPAQQLWGPPVADELLSAAERSKWTKTSTCAEVDAFLAACQALKPDLLQLEIIGRSLQGRPIRAVHITPSDPAPKLRAVLMANIHGGEVEGKEAVQALIRELCLGEHRKLRRAVDLWFVPIFNVDGNDEIIAGNRASQNGPLAVGKRSNSQSLDLNRDFVKAESPEVRALLGLFNRVDPHLFMDLHTTNGSPHGYHLTYSPSLATNLDPGLDGFLHDEFMPALRQRMLKRHGFRIFDYGNFPRRSRGAPRSWTTYDHKPRLAFNYYGLRNRLGLLSEAYSYLPFKQRALVTRAFVLESLRELVARQDEVLALCAAADHRAIEGKIRFGYNSSLRKPVRGGVLVGKLDRAKLPHDLGTRMIATDEYEAVEMDVRVRFSANSQVDYPRAWVLLDPPASLLHSLLDHGIEVRRLNAASKAPTQDFEVEGMSRARYVFQGHRMVGIKGTLREPDALDLPAGSYLVPGRQRLARVAAQLLDPHSEDSLATWNAIPGIRKGGVFPIRRLASLPKGASTPLRRAALGPRKFRAGYQPLPAQAPACEQKLLVVCTAQGRQVRGRAGFERGRQRFEGRRLAYTLNGAELQDLSSLNEGQLGGNALLVAGATVTNQELLDCAAALRKAGCTEVYLKRQPE